MSRETLIKELHDAMRRRETASTFADAAQANADVLEILDLLQDSHLL